MPKTYYVYILASKRNGTLYIGVTNDLARRIREHCEGLVPGFTKKYGVKRLVYFEEYGAIGDAIHRETQLKKYKREWKTNLIQKNNAEWRDLAADGLANRRRPVMARRCAGHPGGQKCVGRRMDRGLSEISDREYVSPGWPALRRAMTIGVA